MSFTAQELQQIRSILTKQINGLEDDRNYAKRVIRAGKKHRTLYETHEEMYGYCTDSLIRDRKILDRISRKIAKLADLQKSVKLEQSLQVLNAGFANEFPQELYNGQHIELVEIPNVLEVGNHSFPIFVHQSDFDAIDFLLDQEEQVEVEKVEAEEVSSRRNLPTDYTSYVERPVSNDSKQQLLADLQEAGQLADQINKQVDTITDILEANRAVVAADPTAKQSNPKDLIGSGKMPIHLWPTTATLMGSIGLLDGMLKYGRSNFRAIGVRASIYYDACNRHLNAWFEGEECDPDSGLPHLAHALACLAIIVDAQATGKFTDDRAVRGGYRKLVEELTPHVARLKAVHADKSPRHYTIADAV